MRSFYSGKFSIVAKELQRLQVMAKDVAPCPYTYVITVSVNHSYLRAPRGKGSAIRPTVLGITCRHTKKTEFEC